MIEFKINGNGDTGVFIAGGTPSDLFADSVILLKEVYKAIKEKDPDEALKFRMCIGMVMMGDGPVDWEEIE